MKILNKQLLAFVLLLTAITSAYTMNETYDNQIKALFEKMGTAKEKSLSDSIEKIIGLYIQKYGKLKEFRLDIKTKQIYLDILPDGEKESIKVDVVGYDLLEEKSKLYFRLHSVKTSKIWATKLAQDYVVNRYYLIEGEYAPIIKKVM